MASAAEVKTDQDASGVPSTMRAALYRSYGGAEVVEVSDAAPVPVLRDDGTDANEIVVRVHAASINPIDYKLMAGDFKLLTGKTVREGGVTLGFDLAGTVVAVGSAVTRLQVGDEVFADGSRRGSFAEYVKISEACAVKKPSNLSFLDAATVPLAGLTAIQALRTFGNLEAGQRVLVLGGSGGVGSFAIQIAKAIGAGEIITTSTNTQLVQRLGADVVINYRNQKIEDVVEAHSVDLVFDCVGGRDGWISAQHVLKRRGKFVTIVGDSAAPLTFSKLACDVGRSFRRNFRTLFGRPTYKLLLTNAQATEDLESLRSWIEEGLVRPLIDTNHEPFTLDTVAGMVDQLKTHRTKGKLRLQVV